LCSALHLLCIHTNLAANQGNIASEFRRWSPDRTPSSFVVIGHSVWHCAS
jgi:hypothetical protein